MDATSGGHPHLSRRLGAVAAPLMPFKRYFDASGWARRHERPDHCDFAFGNPQELPLPGLVDALRTWATPQDKDWFAYPASLPAACEVVAESLRRDRPQAFCAEDVLMTNGAFAGLGVLLTALIDPGDEVVFISPPWFFYESIITLYGGRPVRVGIDPVTFDLDVGAIEAAITPRTRAVLINSPHNPTGKIYPPDTLRDLARVLTAAGDRHGRPIALLSDEAYCRIVYDGRAFPSPTEFYPHSLLFYTYGKTLLAPGQRLGYIAVPPDMPGREALREGLMAAQFAVGYAFPNSLLQHAIADIDPLSIDIAALQRKRDRMVSGLRDIGYRVHVPEGTFYVMVESPIADDWAFLGRLDAAGVYCLPGSIVELPGHFRLSLTATEDMIERALPVLAAEYRAATAPAR